MIIRTLDVIVILLAKLNMSKPNKQNKQIKTNKERKVKFFGGSKNDRPKSAPVDIGPPTKVTTTYCEDCVMIDAADFGDYFSIEKQSANAEIVDTHTEAESVDVVGTTTFHDEAKGLVSEAVKIGELDHFGDNTPSVPLGQFLQRPVLIQELSWSDSNSIGPQGLSFRPWHKYLDRTVIRKKIDNYAFLRGNLHVKAIINASPFYHGRAQLAYQPLVNFRSNHLGTHINDLIPYSQRKGIWIDPASSEGGEIILPFFYHKNWLDITNEDDVLNMGRLDFNIYSPLNSANGVGSITLPIQIFAWMSEVEVMGPTSGVAMQSGNSQVIKMKKKKGINLGKTPTNTNEFKNTTISDTASAIAIGSTQAAGILASCGLPELAPFALGVAETAAGVSSLASLLGFTNTPLLEPTKTFKNQPLSQLASPEISGPLERLSMDPQNGITIDNKTVGLGNDDNMLINSMVCKDSYLTTFTLSDQDVSGDTKFTSRVSPCLWAKGTDSTYGYKRYNMLPMFNMGTLFSFWRGDIIFTFVIIATQYHKGRIKISFEPNSQFGASGPSDSYTTNFTRIVDIGKDNVVSITVPYMQAVSWCRTHKATSQTLDGTLPYTTTPGDMSNDVFSNGLINVQVITPVSAPVATANVDILVWVKAGDNIEFACPRDAPSNVSFIQPQSGAPEDIDDEDNEILGSKSNPGHPKRYLINHGEAILSFRQLLRRTCHYRVTQFPEVAVTKSYARVTYNAPTYPPFYGYDSNGMDRARNQGDTFWTGFNYIANTPYHFLSVCYIGMRGSINKRVNLITPGDVNINHFAATRLTDNVANPLVREISAVTTSSSDMARQLLRGDDTTFAAGATITNFRIMPTLEYNVPMYNNYKFISTNPMTKVKGSAYDGSDRTHTQIQCVFNATDPHNANISNSFIEEYFCIGPDFSLVYFLDVPTMWALDAPTAEPDVDPEE
jgi:hypothetical protein